MGRAFFCHWCNPLETRLWFCLGCSQCFFESTYQFGPLSTLDSSLQGIGWNHLPTIIHSKYVSNPESKIESWTPGNYGRNISYNILETLFYLILGATILGWKVILPCLRQNLWQSPWRSMAIPPTDIDPENHYLVEECVLPTPVWQGLC